MLLFLGTGKSLQRILLAPVKIPTQEPAENQTDSESTSNSILCLHYYKLCCPTLWWGEGDSLKCQKISGKKRKTGPNHCRLNSFLNVHKSREKFFSRWFWSLHIIILSHEHGHWCYLFIAWFFNILTHCAGMNKVKKNLFFVFQLTSWLEIVMGRSLKFRSRSDPELWKSIPGRSRA